MLSVEVGHLNIKRPKYTFSGLWPSFEFVMFYITLFFLDKIQTLMILFTYHCKIKVCIFNSECYDFKISDVDSNFNYNEALSFCENEFNETLLQHPLMNKWKNYHGWVLLKPKFITFNWIFLTHCCHILKIT